MPVPDNFSERLATAIMMLDNKHYQADKSTGFWDFVTKDPGDYVGRHRICKHLWHRKNKRSEAYGDSLPLFYRVNNCTPNCSNHENFVARQYQEVENE